MDPKRYLIFFLIKFPVECRQNHVWGPSFDPSYDHIYKCVHFGNYAKKARSIARSLDRSLARSIARSLDRSLVRIASGVRISNYGYSGESFGGFEFRIAFVNHIYFARLRITNYFSKELRSNIFIVSGSSS